MPWTVGPAWNISLDIRYKKEIDFTKEMEQELSECARMSTELDARMDRLRKEADI